jgi:hypothetical protein
MSDFWKAFDKSAKKHLDKASIEESRLASLRQYARHLSDELNSKPEVLQAHGLSVSGYDYVVEVRRGALTLLRAVAGWGDGKRKLRLIDGIREYDKKRPDFQDFDDWRQLEGEFAKLLPRKLAEVEERKAEFTALGLF